LLKLRPPQPSEAQAAQAVWESSSVEDDPGGWSRGGWSVAAWATDIRVLVRHGRLVGIAAVRGEAAPDGAMPARVALDLDAREAHLAERLVEGVLELVSAAGGARARLFAPARAEWALAAARAAGFEPVRTIAHMQLAGEAPTPFSTSVKGVSIRAIRPDEDGQVLAALNRAWAGTWNFVTITSEMLAEDLRGQREGMLLGVDVQDRIVATCHAVFEPQAENPDGGPRAWISNLTVAPEQRGRGIARTMLAAGIAYLRNLGATSITLGVDADDPAPFSLYQSVGFRIASQLEAWDRAT
jgi:mycothiol synthase